MLLVTEGKLKINQLGYNQKTSEYVFFHKGKEIWRMKGNRELLNYFSHIRATYQSIDEETIKDNEVWIRYCNSCDEFI